MFTGSRSHQFDHQRLVPMTDRRAMQRRPVPPSLTADAFGNHQVIFGEDQDGPWAACDQCSWRER